MNISRAIPTTRAAAQDGGGRDGEREPSIDRAPAPPSAPAVPLLRIRALCKGYTLKHSTTWNAVLDHVDLDVAQGEVLTIIGPSGCGKTTLLNCIAGLIPFEEGTIEVAGESVTGPGLDRAMVFQSASLLPWRTVLRNVEYGLELRGTVPRVERRSRAEEAIGRVGLAGFENAFPNELSGGMQQRVNLARALATEAPLVVMDEPFGSLDAFTKEALQEDILRIVEAGTTTVVFVTHSIEEAVLLGDAVMVMATSPARVVDIVRTELSRPRSLSIVESSQFRALVQRLRKLMADRRTTSSTAEGGL